MHNTKLCSFFLTIFTIYLAMPSFADTAAVTLKDDSVTANAALEPAAPTPEANAKAVTPVRPIDNEQIRKVLSPEEYEGFVGAQTYAEETSTYTLGANDVIEITVMRHPEVSGQYPINAEGKIQYEFVGDILVAGAAKQKATEIITEQLSKYIINPEVSVKIVGYNSKVVYVVGEVGRPGKIFMRGDTITIREALLEAGLPLLSASTKKAKMFTPDDSGKVRKTNVNIHALLFEGDLRENLVMKPGDTLFLPATFWAKATRIINPVAQPIGTAAGTGRTLTTGF